MQIAIANFESALFRTTHNSSSFPDSTSAVNFHSEFIGEFATIFQQFFRTRRWNLVVYCPRVQSMCTNGDSCL